MIEQWRPVKGYEGLYEVSDSLRVRALARKLTTCDGRTRNLRMRYMIPRVGAGRFLIATLSKDSVLKTYRVVDLMDEAFGAK